MSRLYDDGGSFTYNAAEGKLESVPFGSKTGGAEFDGKPGGANVIAENTPAAGESYIPYDYAATAAKVAAAPAGQGFNADLDTAEEMMIARVDNTLIGNMRDCGECHVGGGGMEYFPRNESWDGTAAGGRQAFRTTAQDPAEYTSFNYFIDIYDDDNDGDHNEPLFNDFTKTGVIEMDCLQCHMEGYSWDASKAAKREGRFDASRVAGAGFGTASTLPWNGDNTMPAGFGTNVTYNAAVVVDASNNATVDLSASLNSVPPTDNCASCHQGKYQVDWKKRGEMSASTDVHNAIGCMGCHERKEDINTGSVFAPSDNVGTSLNIRDGKLGHDPAKGGAGQWDSLNNKNDWKEFKKCADCHFGTDLGSRGKSYAAPNPNAAHAAAGLTALIVQGKSRSGVPSASHIDIISCEACHITKSSEVPHDLDEHNYFPGFTQTEKYASGGCFVDGTGPDHEGRLATHDTPYVSRPMYTDANGSNFGYTWAKDGKIHAGNMLTSLFWRDKNDVSFDVNVDGRPHGMDAVLPTHVLANAVAQNAAHPNAYAILADGVSDDAEVAQHISDLNAALPALNGQNGKTQKLKLSWVTVAFTMSHQIEPAADAFGANGCTDCHGSGQFFDGTIDMAGYSDFGFAAAQTTPMTKVQGGTEKTFGHPNMKDKFGFISIPLMNNNGPATATATASIRDMDRSEGLYEVAFRTRNKTWYDTITGGAMFGNADSTKNSMVLASSNSTTWKGWLLKLEVCDATGQTDASAFCNADLVNNTTLAAGADGKLDNVVLRSMMIGPSSDPALYNNITTLAISGADGLLEQMPANFTSTLGTAGNFGFQVKENATANGIEIVTDPAVKVRVFPQSNYGAFKIPSYVLTAAPIIPTVKGIDAEDSLSGRADMIAYLNALGAPSASEPTCTVAEEYFGLCGAPAAPAATIEGVEGVTASDGVSTYYTANAGDAVTFTPETVAGWNVVSVTSQDIADGSDEGTAFAGSFAEAGTYRVVTEYQNVEGKIVKDIQYFVIDAALEGDFGTPTTTGAGNVTLVLNSSPGTYDSVLVNWADGTAQNFYSDLDPLTNDYPAAMSGQTVRVNVAFYNGTDVVAAWATDVTVP